MAAFAISYDLRKKDETSYENLFKAIKNVGTNWCHYLESDWVVITSKTSLEVCNALTPHIHRDDKLIVF